MANNSTSIMCGVPTVAGAMVGRGAGIIGDAETGRGAQTTLDRLKALYEAQGVDFLPDGQVRIKAGGAK